MTEWVETRPGKITMRETVRAENAFARSVFALSGISKIRSIAYGTNCPYCQALNGKVIGIDSFFLIKGNFQPEGAEKPLTVTSNRSHPPYHDGCLPGYSRITAEGITSASKRWYDGDIVIIATARGHKLAVTPNHPILTPQGWISSGLLNVGDDVISNVRGQGIQFRNSDGKNTPSRIEDIVESFINNSEMISVPVPTASKDFHGDGVNSEVAIVGTNRLLWNTIYAPLVEQGAKLSFGGRNTNTLFLSCPRCKTTFPETFFPAGGGKIGSRGLGFPLFRSHFARPDKPGFTARTQFDLALRKMTINHTATDSEIQSDAINRLSSEISSDKIVRIKRNSFHGYVFNLQTKDGFYFADNIITHNCDCGITANI